jgi:hypothetical protein
LYRHTIYTVDERTVQNIVLLKNQESDHSYPKVRSKKEGFAPNEGARRNIAFRWHLNAHLRTQPHWLIVESSKG